MVEENRHPPAALAIARDLLAWGFAPVPVSAKKKLEDNPEASEYSRMALPDERPFCNGEYIVRVEQIEPGVSIRTGERSALYNTGAEGARA